VILIIGILAAIAIPAFLNQKSKANDARVKSQARTAQTAAEVLATDNGGSYANTTLAALQTTEATLNDTTTATLQAPSNVTASTYTVTSKSNVTGDTFSINRLAGGTVTRTCTGTGGGCVGGSW